MTVHTVVYFDQQTHAWACIGMVEIDEKHSKIMKKVPFSSCVLEAHVRLMKENEEKSLLVSDWEWLPKAGWHPNPGCSFEILFFFVLFSTFASHVHDAKCSLKIPNEHFIRWCSECCVFECFSQVCEWILCCHLIRRNNLDYSRNPGSIVTFM